MLKVNRNVRDSSLNTGAAQVSHRQSLMYNDSQQDKDGNFDDDVRIDWERKRKRRRERESVPEDVTVTEDEIDEVLQPSKAQPSSGVGRKKKRQLVYDEETDRIVVRRKRKRQRDFYDDEW